MLQIEDVERLLHDIRSGTALTTAVVLRIVAQAEEVLRAQPNVVVMAPPTEGTSVTVVGDLHGSFADLSLILEKRGLPSEAYTTLHYTTLHYTTLRYATLHYY